MPRLITTRAASNF